MLRMNMPSSKSPARRSTSREGKKSKGTLKPPARFNGHLGDEEQFAFQANLLADMGHAMLATDTQLRITYWNAAVESLYSYSADGRVLVYVWVNGNVSNEGLLC